MHLRNYLIIGFQFILLFSFSQEKHKVINNSELENFAKENNLTNSEYQYLLKRKNGTFSNEKVLSNFENSSITSCVGNNVTNIGFEQGNFNGWTIEGGFNNSLDPDSISIGTTVPVTAILSGGTDAVTGYNLVSPLGGAKILKMNDNLNNGSITILKTKFRVTNQTQFLKTAFAVIMQTAFHQCRLNPYFKIEIFNCNETTKLEEYFTLMQENPCIGKSVLSTTVVSGISCTDWRTHCFDLSNYLNNTVTIKISMADCPLTGHYCYGYFDAIFEPANPSTLNYNYSINNTNLTFNQSNAITCYTNGISINLPSGAANYISSSATLTTFTSSAQSYSLNKTGTVYVFMENAAHNCIQQQRYRAGITPTLILTPVTPSSCPNGQFSITISGADSFYSWQYYTNVTPTSVTTVTDVPTTYTFTGVNAGLCASTSTIFVPMFSVTPISITPLSQTICSSTSTTLNASGSNTYTWNTSSNSSSIVVIPTTANTFYSVSGHDSNGCFHNSAPYNATVTVITTNTNITVGAYTYTICPGDSTYVTANGPSVTSYSWSNGSNLASVYLKPLATTIYTVWGTTPCGILTTTVMVTVKPIIPTTIVINSPTVACSNTSFSVNCTGATNYTFVGASIVTNTTGLAYVNIPLSATSFTIKAKHIPNCYYTTSIVPISVLPLPTLTVTPSAQTVCAGQQATVTGQGALSYVWKNYLFGTLGTGSTVSFTQSPGNTLPNYLQGTDVNGCVSTQSFITYFEPNSLGISVTQNTLCLNATNPITLTPFNVNYANNTYTWNSSIVSYVLTDTPTITTTYTLQSYNAACGYTTAYTTLTVFPSYGPTITAAITPTQFCIGQSASVTTTGALKYNYPYYGISTNTSVNVAMGGPASTYSIVGFDSFGCKSNIVSLPINVVAQPSLSNFFSQTICPGTTLAIIATGTAVGTYSWNTSQISSSIVVSPTSTTTYSLYGYSTNNACYTLETKIIYTYQSPTVSISPFTPSICPGGSITLSANSVSSSVITYTWSTMANSNSIMVSPSVAATYSVIGKDFNNCVASDQVTVGIFNTPTVAINIQNPMICSSTVNTISASASPPGGVLTPSNFASYNYPVGTHTLYYKYNDPITTCTNSTWQTFTINPNPCVSVFSNMDTICLSQTATLTTVPLGGTLTGQFLSGNTFSPTVANNYSFIYSYIDVNGCFGSACEDIFVMLCTTAEKEFALFNSLTIFPNPFNNTFRINNPENVKILYIIMDLNGRLVEENTINNSVEIEMSNKPSGFYFIKLQATDKEQVYKTYKLIKN